MKRFKAASPWDCGTHKRNAIDSMLFPKLRKRRTGQRLSPDEIVE
jgi:hypothetical protein